MVMEVGRTSSDSKKSQDMKQFFNTRKLSHGKGTIMWDERWGTKRVYVAKLLHWKPWDCLMVFVILLNIVIVWNEADLNARGEMPENWMTVLGHVCICFFAIETAMRIFTYRWEFFTINKAYLFDFAVVFVDVSVMIASVCGLISNEPVLSVLRLLRLMLFVNHTSLHSARELYLIVWGSHAATRALFWAFLLLAFVLMFWAILAVHIIHPLNLRVAETGVYDGCERCPRAFASVFQAMLTFTQQTVAGDSWGLVTLPIIEAYPWTIMIFAPVFMTLVSVVMNLMFAVICDQTAEAREKDKSFKIIEKEKMARDLRNELKGICEELDVDGSGLLTLAELKVGAEHHENFQNILRLMDVGEHELDMVFRILDENGDERVDYDEFVNQLFKMKMECDHTMLVFIKYHLSNVQTSLSEQLQIHKQELQGVQKSLERLMHLEKEIEHIPRRLSEVVSESTEVCSEQISRAHSKQSAFQAERIPCNGSLTELRDTVCESLRPGTEVAPDSSIMQQGLRGLAPDLDRLRVNLVHDLTSVLCTELRDIKLVLSTSRTSPQQKPSSHWARSHRPPLWPRGTPGVVLTSHIGVVDDRELPNSNTSKMISPNILARAAPSIRNTPVPFSDIDSVKHDQHTLMES